MQTDTNTPVRRHRAPSACAVPVLRHGNVWLRNGGRTLLACGLLLGACTESSPLSPLPPAGALDSESPPSDSQVDTAEARVPPALPELFPEGLPASELLGEVSGLRALRTIIHAHTVYSHDACDGQPVLESGEVNEACLASFRTALCTDRIDMIFLTEHTDRMALEMDFEKLFLHRTGDEWVEEDGRRVANAVVCEDGHRALIVPGLEGSGGGVSVLGMFEHPAEGSAEAVKAAYEVDSAEGIQNLRAHGAVPVAIHLENTTVPWLQTTDLDAIEVGNLHILVAPDIREEIGLPPETPVVAFTEWLFSPEKFPDPDLVFLAFHERLDLYHEWWDAVLSQRMISGFAGNDVHQNVLDIPMADGDRPDSYRRMMKWYSNYALVEEATPSAVRKAITKGRLFMVFEILGSPVGMDFRAESGEQSWGMGEQVPTSARTSEGGLRLRAPVPTALIGNASVPTSPVMRLFRITSEGSEKVATVNGALDFTVETPGRYRLEIFLTPTHLQPYLQGNDALLREFPWVYSNPIEIL